MITKASGKHRHNLVGNSSRGLQGQYLSKVLQWLRMQQQGSQFEFFFPPHKTKGFCIFRIVSLQGFFCNGNGGYVVCSLSSSWWRKNSHPHSVSLHHPWQFSNPFFLHKKTWWIQSLPRSPFDVRKFTYTCSVYLHNPREFCNVFPHAKTWWIVFWESSEKS
jgi:hypothetical protein